MSKKKPPKLKSKKVKGRIKTLRALPYRGSMIYLRVIDGEIFEWLLIFQQELYTGYLEIKPVKGKKKLSDTEISQSAALALQGALTTIDTLYRTKLDRKTRRKIESESKKKMKAVKKEKKVYIN